MAMLAIHTPIPDKDRALYNLPADARWFASELGALTAYTLLQGSYFVKVYILSGTCVASSIQQRDDSNSATMQEAGHLPLYGVYTHSWDYRGFNSDTVYKPRYPFELMHEAKYDRCRCTLMRVQGALYKEPQVELIPEEEMVAFARKAQIEFPISEFKWARTKEEAMKLGAHVTRWTVDDTAVFFSIFGEHAGCNHIHDIFSCLLLQNSPRGVYPQTLRRLKWGPVSSCAMYGHSTEGNGADPDMQSVSYMISHQDDTDVF
jgi:hypothetical protein